MNNLLDKLNQEVNLRFKDDKSRLKHIQGVVEMSLHLAHELKVDYEKCSIIALFHDIMKNASREEQLKYISKEELDSLQTDVLIHAVAASNYAKEVYNITDLEILTAIKSHVYGNLNMSIYDKIILVSDFAEQNRTYKYCLDVRKLVLSKKFDEALKATINLTVQSLLDRNIEPTKEQLEIQRKYG